MFSIKVSIKWINWKEIELINSRKGNTINMWHYTYVINKITVIHNCEFNYKKTTHNTTNLKSKTCLFRIYCPLIKENKSSQRKFRVSQHNVLCLKFRARAMALAGSWKATATFWIWNHARGTRLFCVQWPDQTVSSSCFLSANFSSSIFRGS